MSRISDVHDPVWHVEALGTERTWSDGVLTAHWGSVLIARRGAVVDAGRLPALVARLGNEHVGLLTYRIEGSMCEIVTLNSLTEGTGIGSALLDALVRTARSRFCDTVWVVTTNDNLKALRFYQKRGFRLAAVRPNAVETSRRLKPSIPLLGADGIPMRDELELRREI